MKKNIENTLRNSPKPYITDIELKTILSGTPDSRYAKIKRLTAEDKLVHIRRGLYCITDSFGYRTKPHPFELAQYIYGPSCISMESALSFHELIPEAVYTTTSISTKRSREFNSDLGLFTFTHCPVNDFYTEVELISQDGYKFLMAKPWRAICDYFFCYKKNWGNLEALLKDLRIDLDDLPTLSNDTLDLLSNYYRNNKLHKFLIQVKNDLKQELETVL